MRTASLGGRGPHYTSLRGNADPRSPPARHTSAVDPIALVAPFALTGAEVELAPGDLDPEQIQHGTPVVRELTLWTSADGRQEVGVWEITPGVVTDTEADEAFVVLSGRATVAIDGGPTLTLAPGTVAVLRAGDQTVWTVTETLRKVYSAAIAD